jgi:hypothetical protein
MWILKGKLTNQLPFPKNLGACKYWMTSRWHLEASQNLIYTPKVLFFGTKKYFFTTLDAMVLM